MKKVGLWVLALMSLAACSKGAIMAPEGDYYRMDGAVSKDGSVDVPGGGSGGEGGSGSAQGQAGRLTAGEWKDLDHWDFWGKLMEGEEYGKMSSYWGFYTSNRVAVLVEDAAGKPVAGVKVALQRSGKDIWNAVTDNRGRADLFVGLFQKEEADPSALTVSLSGEVQPGVPAVTGWKAEQGVSMNRYVFEHYTYTTDAPQPVADIAFLVDATGSMGDEILFLKEDLLDILNKASQASPAVRFRTAALFYRDEGDEYVTRHSDFSADFSVTHEYVKAQRADGGGDYPEAVHTALEKGLQSLSWSETARARLAFLVLDAPAHYRTEVLESLQKSIEAYARLGIRLIPVAASGVDKNTEFMCRFFAVSTGGTYVFLTNDSGIGGDHIAPTIGEYKVEQLNELLLRLIAEYTR